MAEDVRMSGGNVLTRWRHVMGERSDFQLQFYVDRTKRNELTFQEVRNTYDIDFQHRLPLPFGQDVVWGLGYRISNDHLRNSDQLIFDPSDRSLRTFSAFVQDEIRLLHDHVRLTVGAKYLKNSFTGGLIQPNFRLLWTPDSKQTVWASVTRANRIPSRLERDARQLLAGTDLGFLQIQGNPMIHSENLWGYELGYRAQLSSAFSVDIAVFYNSYTHSHTEEEISETVKGIDNDAKFKIYGGEISGEWRVFDWWSLRPTFSYLQVKHSAPTGHEVESGDDPAHQMSLRSLVNISRTIEFDSTFRFVDRLPGIGVSSYANLDLRLGWRPSPALEFSLVGHNLLQTHHQEFQPEFIRTAPSQIQRGVYGKVTWRF